MLQIDNDSHIRKAVSLVIKQPLVVLVAAYYLFLAVGIQFLLVSLSVDKMLASLGALVVFVSFGAFSSMVFRFSQRHSDTQVVRAWSEAHAAISLIVSISGLAGYVGVISPMWGMDPSDWRLVVLGAIMGTCLLHIVVLHHVLPWSAAKKPSTPSE